MIVKDSGVDRCRSVVWAADPRMWGAFVADSDSETTYVGEKLGEHGIGVVAEVVAYSLWIKGIGGKEGWVTGWDQGKAGVGLGGGLWCCPVVRERVRKGAGVTAGMRG